MNLVVIGAQWGDEGKGKIVDFLAEDCDLVIRFSGGANAGHTVVVGETTYKLHLVPSGIIYDNKKVVMGSGMVIDPEALFKELSILEDQGVDWQNRVFVSDRAHLVLPQYKDEDVELEKNRYNPLGTTGRGIGNTYAHKAYRDGVRIADLYDSAIWAKLPAGYRDFFEPYKERLAAMSVNLAYFIEQNKDKRILFEGAQGTLLDIDVGTYPFVSSGSSASGGAAAGGGLGPRRLDAIYGVFKAYSTRVGNGPFPTEFDLETEDELLNYVRETGREYGVTTGRPRRCGYLDLVALRYACLVNGMDSLVLTHLDVYDTLNEVKVCVAYEIDGRQTKEFPTKIEDLEKAKPVLKTMPGWQTDLGGITGFGELPPKAVDYIKFIEDYTGTPVGVLSVGYQRRQTLLKSDPWKK